MLKIVFLAKWKARERKEEMNKEMVLREKERELCVYS